MELRAEVKHILHVTFFMLWLFMFEVAHGVIPILYDSLSDPIDTGTVSDMERYGYLCSFLLYGLRFLSLLSLPQTIFNVLGLVLFNGFYEKVKLKASPLLAPLICFRVVTRGDYPELVKQNMRYNMAKCRNAGMENFFFEVVTDKAVDLRSFPRLREVVVPTSYSGALFKSRALQYCLEADINILQDHDWIVHLDEETLLTVNSICGILNFCGDGKHQFGQGLITYASGDVVNWITTLSDSYRVADDMGKLKFQLRVIHRPLFGWKGSFVVTKVGAERDVSFDHGKEGSIAEDCFFSMIAYKKGYSFDFIEGEMHEKSPFTYLDFLQQRKRWLQGICLTVHSKRIPFRYKILLSSSFYAWVTMPLTSLQVYLLHSLPLQKYFLMDFLLALIAAVNLYMYIYGVIMSFMRRSRQSHFHLLSYVVCAILTIPFNVSIEIAAVIWGLFTSKNGFYIVKKSLDRPSYEKSFVC